MRRLTLPRQTMRPEDRAELRQQVDALLRTVQLYDDTNRRWPSHVGEEIARLMMSGAEPSLPVPRSLVVAMEQAAARGRGVPCRTDGSPRPAASPRVNRRRQFDRLVGAAAARDWTRFVRWYAGSNADLVGIAQASGVAVDEIRAGIAGVQLQESPA